MQANYTLSNVLPQLSFQNATKKDASLTYFGTPVQVKKQYLIYFAYSRQDQEASGASAINTTKNFLTLAAVSSSKENNGGALLSLDGCTSAQIPLQDLIMSERVVVLEKDDSSILAVIYLAVDNEGKYKRF